MSADLDELQKLELKEAFDEFDKAIITFLIWKILFFIKISKYNRTRRYQNNALIFLN